MTKEQWVDSKLGSMTLEMKVGQLMVIGFTGPIIRPDTAELVKKHHIGGLRIGQKFIGGFNVHRNRKDLPDFLQRSTLPPDVNTFDTTPGLGGTHCTISQYATTLNELRQMSLDRENAVPLHYTFDQEGEGCDFIWNYRFFPYPMGLAATGDKDLIYRVSKALARQARALGVNMIHSPVLDVNTDVNNPEVGPRAFSDDPDLCAEYALETLRAFREENLMATGKHFPGRGPSNVDAHFELPVIPLTREEMMTSHVAPYQKLIDAGLPCVMAAYSAYEAFDPGDDTPAAASRNVITHLLREELGFEGVITSDNVPMHGLMKKYEVSEAVIRVLLAGCDLILCRTESPVSLYIIEKVIEAVNSGRYPEEMLDASVKRILGLRYDMGLAEDCLVDPAHAASMFEDPEIRDVSEESIRKTTLMLKNDNQHLPLPKEEKVLLIEQVHHFHEFINDVYSHPGLLWEALRRKSDHVRVSLIKETYTEQDRAWTLERAAEADTIICTSYYNYRTNASMVELLREIHALGKKLIVVSNTPYEKFGVPAEIDTAVITFCPSVPEGCQAVADMIYGDLENDLTLPVQGL